MKKKGVNGKFFLAMQRQSVNVIYYIWAHQ